MVPRPGVKDHIDHVVKHVEDTGRSPRRDARYPETPMDLDDAQQLVWGKSWLRLKTRDELRISHELRPHYRGWDQTAPIYG